MVRKAIAVSCKEGEIAFQSNKQMSSICMEAFPPRGTVESNDCSILSNRQPSFLFLERSINLFCICRSRQVTHIHKESELISF